MIFHAPAYGPLVKETQSMSLIALEELPRERRCNRKIQTRFYGVNRRPATAVHI